MVGKLTALRDNLLVDSLAVNALGQKLNAMNHALIATVSNDS